MKNRKWDTGNSDYYHRHYRGPGDRNRRLVHPHAFPLCPDLGRYHFRQRVDAGTPVTLAYRHSVQKTMIYEYLEVNQIANGFVLKSTKYQSMGVGLPFSADEGKFREEDGWFILDDINRNYPELSIRNGVTNHGVLTVGDKDYDLDAMVPLGKEMKLYVAPLYKGWYMKKKLGVDYFG